MKRREPTYKDIERCLTRAEFIRDHASTPKAWLNISELADRFVREANHLGLGVGDLIFECSEDNLALCNVAMAIILAEKFAKNPAHQLSALAQSLLVSVDNWRQHK